MKKLYSFEKALQLNEPISTERLILEPILGKHGNILYNQLQDPRIYEWISIEPPISPGRLTNWWNKRESRLSFDGTEAWLDWAVKRLEDNAYVGRFDAEVNQENIATNIGYIFFPAYWRMGYATESVRAVCHHFEKHGITKIFANVSIGHDASNRVLEKSGFIRSRVIPEKETIRGIKFDSHEYIRETKSSVL